MKTNTWNVVSIKQEKQEPQLLEYQKKISDTIYVDSFFVTKNLFEFLLSRSSCDQQQ